MIPVEAIFAFNREFVGEVTPGSDRILVYIRWHVFDLAVHIIANLCYPGDPIHLGCSTLKEA